MNQQPTPPMGGKRTLPTSDLDLQMMVTDPEWGKATVSNELRIKLRNLIKSSIEYDEEGVAYENVVYDDLWDLLSYYTRDMRLGNLSEFRGEIGYCRHYLEFAGDALATGNVNAFIIALTRVINVLELSQSRSGFLRKLFNTFSQEYKQEVIEPKKKGGLFGGKKKDDY